MSHLVNQVTLLQLAAGQLTLSLKETEQPFDDLSKLFIEIVEGFNEIEALLSSGQSSDILKVQSLHALTQNRVKNAIIDFQFYDRMTQRLNHIMVIFKMQFTQLKVARTMMMNTGRILFRILNKAILCEKKNSFTKALGQELDLT
ncbi:MAG: hypothetical protein ACJAS9_001269 [Polaribacter sp.]|jgi:hypothetical protein